MNEILVACARYNKAVNAALSAILLDLPDSVLDEDQGTFFKTIRAAFEHLVGAEINWLKRYPGYFPSKALAGKALLAEDADATKARLGKGIKELVAACAEADDLFVAFAEELDEAKLATRVKYKTYRGDELERSFWNLVFHVFNHGTHHRGEISALLDRKGIKNDYSGFNNYMS